MSGVYNYGAVVSLHDFTDSNHIQQQVDQALRLPMLQRNAALTPMILLGYVVLSAEIILPQVV